MSPASPLAGKRIVITRPAAQAGTFAEKLRTFGAVPILFPTIEIAPIDESVIDLAVGQLPKYDWVVFTSANAVSLMTHRLTDPLPLGLRVAAVGPATARELTRLGWGLVATVPDEYLAEALAEALGEVAGKRILLPHGQLAREELAEMLRRRGAVVDEVVIYRTLPVTPDPTALAEVQRGADVVTFTSGSAARHFANRLRGWLAAARPRPLVACLGPVTADAAREAGLPVDVVPAEYTLDGLIAALAAHWGEVT